MVAEAERLVAEIIDQSGDDEDAAEIAAAGREILAEVGRVDDRLQGVLDRLTVAPEGGARDAAGVIAAYRQILSGGKNNSCCGPNWQGWSNGQPKPRLAWAMPTSWRC